MDVYERKTRRIQTQVLRRRRTGRPAFGNPRTRSASTVWRMGAQKRRMRAERQTSHLVRYTFAMSARTL